MREAYKRSSGLLQTIEYKPTASEDLEKFKQWLLLTAGYPRDQVNSMNVGEMSDDEVAEKWTKKRQTTEARSRADSTREPG